MDYENSIAKAAHRAEAAAWETMAAYRDNTFAQEPAITDALAMALRLKLNGSIEGLKWSSHVLTDRGSGAEEKPIGADLLIHVAFRTSKLTYSKGVLVQAKRIEPGEVMQSDNHKDLVHQCKKMLNYSPASFVFDYARRETRCGSALAIAGSPDRMLYEQCIWTSYRFFLELFRCFIGDPKITSTSVDDLPVPTIVKIEVTDRD